MIKLLISTLVLVMGFQFSGLAEEQWEMKKDTDGIQIFSKEVPGANVVKGVSYVEADLEDVVRFFENESGHSNWLANCEKSTLIESKNSEEKVIYYHLGLPWPATDRDAVGLQRKKVDPAEDTVVYEIEDASSYMPEVDGIQRINSLNGSWKFTRIASNLTLVTYEQLVKPAGKIPSWLLNKLALDMPFNSLKNFRSSVKSTRS